MVETRSGEKKKAAILEAAKKLFYEKGYTETTLSDIAKQIDSPASAISYHFGSKHDLAWTIQSEYSRQNKIYMQLLVGDAYSNTMMMALELFDMWERNLTNDNLRRFLMELSVETVVLSSHFDNVKYLYRLVIEDQGLHCDDNKLNLMAATQIGMTSRLLDVDSLYPNAYTYVDLASHVIHVFCQMIGMSKAQVDVLIANALEIYKTLPIDNRYFDYFAYNTKYVHPVSKDKLLPENEDWRR